MKAASHHSTRSRRPHRHCPFATRAASSKRVTVQELDGYTLSLLPPACKPPEHSVHVLAHGIALFWSAEWGIRSSEWVADITVRRKERGTSRSWEERLEEEKVEVGSSYLLPLASLPLFLCFGEIYSIVTQLPIPLFSAQRVSTRFIVVPATMLVLLAAMRMQDFLVRDKPTHTAKSVIVLFLVLMAWGLYLHSSTWRIYSADLFFLNDDVYGAGPEFVRAPALENPDVRRYVHTVQISAVLSCCAILFFVWRFLRARRR